MSSLYPSLEDMKMDQMVKEQLKNVPYPVSFNNSTMPLPYNGEQQSGSIVYPALGDYMGLELNEAVIKENMPEYAQQLAIYQQRDLVPSGVNSGMIAPISGQSLGLQRAQVTNGIRQLTLCKDKDNKIGIRVRAINNGIFVCLVVENSPAALAGIRFGDQILQISNTTVAGLSMDKVHEMLKKAAVNGINIVVRDRPFERTLTLHKDSTGHVGFQFKGGKIISIVKDSSAAKNGVLTDHQLLEVDGRNVVGLKDKEVTKLIDAAGNVVTITVIPGFVYDHMVKKMHGSLLKGLMDHSLPEF